MQRSRRSTTSHYSQPTHLSQLQNGLQICETNCLLFLDQTFRTLKLFTAKLLRTIMA
jgi:hypothetical protein